MTEIKRSDAINWADWHMGIAMLNSKRSKDPRRQVGACIVTPKYVVVGNGYNGFPKGIKDEDFPWKREGKSYIETKFAYDCHAVRNAIDYRTLLNIEGCILYVTHFPCHECAKSIIQNGIKKVVYGYEETDESRKASKIMFETVKLDCRRFEIDKNRNVLLSFEDFFGKSST